VVVELLLQGLLKESFAHTAYSTNSYLMVDSEALERLQEGEIRFTMDFPTKSDRAGQKKSKRKQSLGSSEEDDNLSIPTQRKRSSSPDVLEMPKKLLGNQVGQKEMLLQKIARKKTSYFGHTSVETLPSAR
jgi:hypothetical protein